MNVLIPKHGQHVVAHFLVNVIWAQTTRSQQHSLNGYAEFYISEIV